MRRGSTGRKRSPPEAVYVARSAQDGPHAPRARRVRVRGVPYVFEGWSVPLAGGTWAWEYVREGPPA